MFCSEIKAVLHRPLIDLEESEDAEFFANAAARSASLFFDAEAPLYPVWIQRRGAPRLRDRLLHEAQHLTSLTQTKSGRWAAVQHALAQWTRLGLDARIKLARTLLQVGCYESVAAALEQDPEVRGEPRLELLRLSVLVGLHRAGILESLPADELLRACERAATKSDGSMSQLTVATLNAFLISLQYSRDAELARAWYARARRMADEFAADKDDFLAQLLSSCLYRATAMWPHSQGDLITMSLEMERCEALATSLEPRGDIERLLCVENLFSVYESRTKERLAMNDLTGAERFATRLVELFPFDSTARIELGEVLLLEQRPAEAAVQYEIASEVSPPGSAVAWFMAGQCHAGAESRQAALTAYTMALRADSLAISAVSGIKQLLEQPATSLEQRIAAWCAAWTASSQPSALSTG
jgi:tetratricopeptide (TPR) repeat protein